jgi:hypothetical protein
MHVSLRRIVAHRIKDQPSSGMFNGMCKTQGQNMTQKRKKN